MKRFIFSRFGLFNFDPKWYEDRFLMFETFCLPSIEKMKNDELYWMILIPDFMPLEFKRKLYSIIDKSLLQANIYVIEYQGLFWERSDYVNFIAKHTDGEELVMMSNLDLDDGLAPNFFDVAEQHVKEKNLRYNYIWFLNGIKFSTYNGNTFSIYDRLNDKMFQESFPLSMAYILVCKCSQVQDFLFAHARVYKEFEQMFVKIDTKEPMYLYTNSGINDVAVRGVVDASVEYKKYDINKICLEIPFLEKDKIKLLSKRYKTLSLPNELIIYHNYLRDWCNWSLNEHKKAKRRFVECINIMQLDKSKQYSALLSYQKDYNTFLDACYQEYEKKAPPKHDLQKYTNVDDYLKALNDFAKDGGVIAIATCAKPCLQKLSIAFKDTINITASKTNAIIVHVSEKQFILQDEKPIRKLVAFGCKNGYKGISHIQAISTDSHAYIATNNFQHYSLDDPGINIVSLIGDNGEYQVVDTVNICDDVLSRRKRQAKS